MSNAEFPNYGYLKMGGGTLKDIWLSFDANEIVIACRQDFG